MPKALISIRLRSSCSGSAVHRKNVPTSFEICAADAGVPSLNSTTCIQFTTMSKINFSVSKAELYLIVNGLCHTDGATRKIWIEVLSFTQNNTGRWISVSGQQGKYIIFAAVSCRCNIRQIRWICTIVCGTGRLFICIRTRKTIGQFARTHKIVALVVRSIFNLRIFVN